MILVFVIVTITRLGGHVADSAHLFSHQALARLAATAASPSIASLSWCMMTAAGFAAVPIYRIFCQATGFGGTVSRATSGARPADRWRRS